MSIKRHIPNFITCLNLFSGCVAVVMALQGHLLSAAVWIMAAAVFDFLDGMAARLLHAVSPIGKDLDSLADVVSFGLAPGMMLFCLLRESAADLPFGRYLPYAAFVIPLFSALRLARFNNDARQTTAFIGLPVPAHALLWASASCAALPLVRGNAALFTAIALPAALGTSLLLVSGLRMFSLKVKTLSWKGNELPCLLVAGSLVFILLWGFLGITGAVLLYIILSLCHKKD